MTRVRAQPLFSCMEVMSMGWASSEISAITYAPDEPVSLPRPPIPPKKLASSGQSLPWTTSGSDRKGITLAENKLQHLSKDGFGLGGFNHHLDQDHREGMFCAIANLA
jgi:hypothetical protein